MRKILTAFTLILCLAMLFGLAGCDNGASSEAKSSSEEPSEPEGPVSIAKEDIKVGVLHITDPDEGAGYTFAHDQGIVAMQSALGLADNQIVRQNNVDDKDKSAIKTATEALLASGCNVIFATSWGFMDTIEEMANEYPEVYFSHGTGYKYNETNFNNYFGRIYQARYLTGIAAGLKTESNKLGYVAAYGTDLAETCSGINAFALGAQAVNPDVEVFVKVVGKWFDPVKETSFAEALLEMDCDVIAQHCDTANPQTAAEKAGKFGCGYNSDMTVQAPAAHLTAPIWNWGVYYTKAVQAVIDGKWAELGNYYGDINDGLIDISPLSDNCAPNTAEYIQQVKDLFKEGTWDVFSGVALSFGDDGKLIKTDKVLLDASGMEIASEGGPSVSDGVITGEMDYYVLGVYED